MGLIVIPKTEQLSLRASQNDDPPRPQPTSSTLGRAGSERDQQALGASEPALGPAIPRFAKNRDGYVSGKFAAALTI